MKNNTYLFLTILFFSACHNKNVADIINIKKGLLKATLHLKEIGSKKFKLDSVSPANIEYSQIYTDKNQNRDYTFLNKLNNSIYFYDYKTSNFLYSIKFQDTGPNKIDRPAGYYIKSLDSIYVFSKIMKILLVNSRGTVLKRVSLINNMKVSGGKWSAKYPQYYPQTAKPFMATSNELLFVGQGASSIPDSIIGNFKFVSHINFSNNAVHFSHLYPREIYGSGYTWLDPIYTEVYVEFVPEKNILVFSFPVSHNLYVSMINSDTYKTFYGGGNEAGAIISIDANSGDISNKEILTHFIKTDEYAAIKYDKYRKVYYRILRNSIPNAVDTTQFKDKPITIIIMDEKFSYLGETTIGQWKNWNIANAFVTKEGLNIEYIDNVLDESFSTIKIFTLK